MMMGIFTDYPLLVVLLLKRKPRRNGAIRGAAGALGGRVRAPGVMGLEGTKPAYNTTLPQFVPSKCDVDHSDAEIPGA
jgi:hypothetical protein